MSVPPYFAFEDGSTLTRRQLGPGGKYRNWIGRSSKRGEDWENPESGLFTSSIYPDWHKGKQVDLDTPIDTSVSGPHIFQEWINGIGITVNVAWSPLLSQNVCRVAVGNILIFQQPYLRVSPWRSTFPKHFFTSVEEYQSGYAPVWPHNQWTRRTDSSRSILEKATRDLMADAAVFAYREDKVIAGLKTPGDFTAFLVNTSEAESPHEAHWATELVRPMATLFAQSIENLGIDFGTEWEVIVHPLEPNVWHLVQGRPSPGVSQMPFTPSKELKRKSAIVSTGITMEPGEAVGTAVGSSNKNLAKDRPYIFTSQSTGAGGNASKNVWTANRMREDGYCVGAHITNDFGYGSFTHDDHRIHMTRNTPNNWRSDLLPTAFPGRVLGELFGDLSSPRTDSGELRFASDGLVAGIFER